jgi:hypothetical protein
VATKQAQPDLDEILRLLRQTPFETVAAALRGQLSVVERWSEEVKNEPSLAALLHLLHAQIAANQRMIDVAKQETEHVASAVQELGKAFGMPTPKQA